MSKAVKDPVMTSSVTTPSEREIHIERIFNAPRNKVWRAFTEPELLAQWWGRGNKLVIEKFELERGGHWRFVEHGPEGDISHRLAIQRLEVEAIAGIEVGGDGLGVGVDHDAADSLFLEGPGGMDAAIVELDTLAYTDGAAAND